MKENINKSLAEQLAINDREIQYRKNLLDFHEYEIKYLTQSKPYISKKIDDIVSTFYEKQIHNAEISLLIGDSETLTRLKGAMRRYILELFDGDYGAGYVNRRLRIGKVHKRIGVPPKLYISAIWLLDQTLHNEIDNAEESEINLLDKTKIKKAINKLLMLDTQFVFDTYISSLVNEVETAKEELQTYTQSLEEIVAERTLQLEQLSRLDGLTSLTNQNTFYEYLRREINVCERHMEELSLIYFDLNNFKQINDTEGHQQGDKILTEVSRAILKSIREVDIGSRYGGDEFCVILPRTSQEMAIEVMQRIIQNFKSFKHKNVTFSIGIACTHPDKTTDADSLVKEADALMYASKKKSRKDNGFHISTSHQTGDGNNSEETQLKIV
ncbi:MAG: GGDEF domain-containing protein [Gammaproteobacteria bacterium]|nr:GGDEF domain-containing protein [Gammaproteobacteria bacterium]